MKIDMTRRIAEDVKVRQNYRICLGPWVRVRGFSVHMLKRLFAPSVKLLRSHRLELFVPSEGWEGTGGMKVPSFAYELGR
jgi:hypothetical protein